MDRSEDQTRLALYLDALDWSKPNTVGAAIQAMQTAEVQNLPPLEITLAGAAVQEQDQGEIAFLRRRLYLTQQPALPGAPHESASNRRAQAVANLVAAGLWPW